MSGKFFYVCEDNDDFPPPVVHISGKNFLGALFFRKVPLETAARIFYASYAAPVSSILYSV
jgi:hypothetical protein